MQIYWILDSMQAGSEPNPKHVGECFIAIRDALMDPDTEAIVNHIRRPLEQSKAAANVLTHQVIGESGKVPLPDHRLVETMRHLAARHRLPVEVVPPGGGRFGRLAEGAHGIG